MTLHVVRGEPHRVADRLAQVLRAREGRNGEGQPPGPALLVVAVNQSLAVLSRAGASDAQLRSVVRPACTTVADTFARTTGEGAARG